MALIDNIRARQILDSRGQPTIEVDVWTSTGVMGRACVPAGASKGSFEAVELRDQNPQIYNGKSVQKAIAGIHKTIAPQLQGIDVREQEQIDQTLIELDGTPNKSRLGANALLAVSLACLKAASAPKHVFQYIADHITCLPSCRLPVPLINILNGGMHANNGLDVQEFMIIPLIKGSFSNALMGAYQVFHSLKCLLEEKGFSTAVGDEGGFAPPLKNNKQALDLICLAVEKTKYKLGEDIFLALDVAATEFAEPSQQNQEYIYLWEGRKLKGEDLMSVYHSWQKDFPLISIEDAFAENDWDSWIKFTRKKDKIQLVGDDLFVTHPERLQTGIERSAANAILIKPNQIGTVSETLQTIKLAKTHKYQTIISHRSGETEDSVLADLAMGLDCPQIKTGSLCRSERLAKYNQLLRIEEALGSQAIYQGRSAFPQCFHLSDLMK